MLDHSLSRYGCGVKISACLWIACECINRNFPWSGSRAQKHILRDSNTVVSLVRLFMWLLRTNESIILLLRTLYFRALEPLHWRNFCLQTRKNSQASRYLDDFVGFGEWNFDDVEWLKITGFNQTVLTSGILLNIKMKNSINDNFLNCIQCWYFICMLYKLLKKALREALKKTFVSNLFGTFSVRKL